MFVVHLNKSSRDQNSNLCPKLIGNRTRSSAKANLPHAHGQSSLDVCGTSHHKLHRTTADDMRHKREEH